MIEDPFVFALMPFSATFQDVYLRGIKAGCEDAGARCERADEQVYNDTIVSRIYHQIVQADVVIAEVSEPNPNVYYEAGFARALGKRLLLLTSSEAKIPFDLKGYRHVVYGEDIDALRKAVAANVRALLAQRGQGQLTATGFPWPALVRRAMAVLDAAERCFAELDFDLDALAADFENFAETLAVRGAPDIQVSLARSNRVLLYHDYKQLIGRPAMIVGMEPVNIVDEIFCRVSGAVAWVDDKSNSPRTPRIRMNFAFFRTLSRYGAKVIVEIHEELR